MRYIGDIRNAAMLIVTFKPITMNHAIAMPTCGAYHLRHLLVVSVNEFVYNLYLYNNEFNLYFVILQTMFYALTRRTSAKVVSRQPRVYADLLKDDDSNITQQVEKLKLQ